MKSKKRIQYLRSKAAESQGWLCYYCSFPMWGSDPEAFKARYSLPSRAVRHFRCTAEHLKARCDGGRDIEENIVAACHYCNRTRHRKKRPKDAACYASFVRSRIDKGRWHPAWLRQQMSEAEVLRQLSQGWLCYMPSSLAE
ncbi:restriction endonuclease [Rhizobium leguminosarum bv. viciae]|nr:restriction endonuclease [Rhizobium leguminosarum bv. viciae]